MTAPVKRYMHISSLCEAIPALMAIYPGADQYVTASDYERLEQECERLREALQASGDELGGILCTTGPARDEWMRQLIERIDAALQAKP